MVVEQFRPAFDFLRRPGVDWSEISAQVPAAREVPVDVARQLDIRAKYEGYIARQDREIQRFSQMDSKLIPLAIDYQTVTGLRNEARQKLTKFTPRSLGQALRISGITPADVTVLAIHLEHLVELRHHLSGVARIDPGQAAGTQYIRRRYRE